MAHLQHNLSTVVRGSGQELLSRYGGMKLCKMSLTNQRRSFEKKRGLIHCCTSSTSTSVDQQLNTPADYKLDSRINEDEKLQFGYLARDVNWQVRRMLETEEEMREVANVQAEAFHEPVFLFDDLFFDFFKVICFTKNPIFIPHIHAK